MRLDIREFPVRLDIRESPVRKTGRFTHVSSIFGHDVREKRFNTHGGRNH